MNELGERVRWDGAGLAPAIVQDLADGRVLMLAYMDAEALAATLATGDVHFHSRSRGRLWRKGETSGNILRLRSIALDCDSDALLVTAEPAGPTCHRGTRSCFDDASASGPPAEVAVTERATVGPQGFAWLEELWATVESRRGADPATSYTARLLREGVDAPGRKVVEEATEVLMAAKDDAVAAPSARGATREALTGEAADLLYHLLVVLAERDLAPRDVIARLQSRHRP